MTHHDHIGLSYTAIAASVVAAKCSAVIQHITEERCRRDEEYVNEFRRKRWWRRELTFQEAVKAILKKKHSDEFAALDFWEYPSFYASDALVVAMKLLAIAEQSSNGTVFVTAADWDYIK